MFNMHHVLDGRADVWGLPPAKHFIFPSDGRLFWKRPQGSEVPLQTLFSLIQNLQIGFKCHLMLATAIAVKRNLYRTCANQVRNHLII